MERKEPVSDTQERDEPRPKHYPLPEEAKHTVPGVKHEPEPDAGNIMPAEHEPGTL
jgi:hypothetical protein